MDDAATKQAEADEFALELLMPTMFLVPDIRRFRVDLSDDEAVTKLARHYKVPLGQWRIASGS